MARKDPSVAALVPYIVREACDQNYNLHHNLLARSTDEIIAEFDDNAKLLKKRKGANMGYHEILSIKRPQGLSETEQKEALRDIAEHYMQARAPDCLVFGGMHDDHDGHLHYHLLISANPLGLNNRHWLTKTQFRKVTVDLERRVLQRYPELEQRISIEKTATRKRSRKAHAVKARLGYLPKQRAFAANLKSMFRATSTLQELRDEMAKRNLEFYLRGRAVGVINTQTGKKDRLQTLDIMSDYEAMRARLSGQQRTQRGAAKQNAKGNDMDFLSFVQGLSTMADILSVGVTPQPQAPEDDDHRQINQSKEAAHKKADTELKRIVKTDRQILADARKAEMKKLRKARQKQRTNKLSRRH